MPTSTLPSAATDTDLTMPRSVIGRWISGSETVASAAWTASSSGEAIAPQLYVGASAGNAGAAADERPQPLFEQHRLDRLDQVVVGAGVAGICLDTGGGVAGEEHHRDGRGPGLAAEQP